MPSYAKRRVKCAIGGEYRDFTEEFFSKNQLKKGPGKGQRLTCREHTPGPRTELKCNGPCQSWKPLREFSSIARKDKEPRCMKCTTWAKETEATKTSIPCPKAPYKGLEEADSSTIHGSLVCAISQGNTTTTKKYHDNGDDLSDNELHLSADEDGGFTAVSTALQPIRHFYDEDELNSLPSDNSNDEGFQGPLILKDGESSPRIGSQSSVYQASATKSAGSTISTSYRTNGGIFTSTQAGPGPIISQSIQQTGETFGSSATASTLTRLPFHANPNYWDYRLDSEEVTRKKTGGASFRAGRTAASKFARPSQNKNIPKREFPSSSSDLLNKQRLPVSYDSDSDEDEL